MCFWYDLNLSSFCKRWFILDLSVRADGHLDSGTIQVEYIFGSTKVLVDISRLSKFSVDQMSLERLFVSYFVFVKIKDLRYLKFKIVRIQ